MLASAMLSLEGKTAGILLDRGMRLALSSPILLIVSIVGLVLETRKFLRKDKRLT